MSIRITATWTAQGFEPRKTGLGGRRTTPQGAEETVLLVALRQTLADYDPEPTCVHGCYAIARNEIFFGFFWVVATSETSHSLHWRPLDIYISCARSKTKLPGKATRAS